MLIKGVCHAMPTYSMSVFHLLTGLCSEIEGIFTRYWWSKRGEKGIHWKNWKALSTHKTKRGLGFCELVNFNQALLAKQGWRSLGFPNSLIARMFKACYFLDSDFVHAQVGSTPSFTWQPIMWGSRAPFSWSSMACWRWMLSKNIWRSVGSSSP